MPIVRLYLAELECYSPHRPDRPGATFVEWSFARPTAGKWAEDGAIRVVRRTALEVFVRAPPLSRLVDRVSPLVPRPWSFPDRVLATHWDSAGLAAELVAGLARRKDRGFSFVTKEEALTAQSSLFAELDAPPEPETDGPYRRPQKTAIAPAPRAPIPSITPENLEDTMRSMLTEEILLGNDLLRFCVLSMATAVARCRESESGSALAAVGLELAIGDVLGRRVGPAGKGGAR